MENKTVETKKPYAPWVYLASTEVNRTEKHGDAWRTDNTVRAINMAEKMHNKLEKHNQELREQIEQLQTELKIKLLKDIERNKGVDECIVLAQEIITERDKLKAEVKRLRGGLRTITTNNHVDANSLQIANQLLKTSGENENKTQ